MRGLPNTDPAKWTMLNCASALRHLAFHWDLLGTELGQPPTKAYIEVDEWVRDVQVDYTTFESWVTKAGISKPRFWGPLKTQKRARVGRPPFDWPSIKHEFDRLMDKNGDFSPKKRNWGAQSRLEVALQMFAGRELGFEPSTSAVRTKVEGWLPEWRKTNGQK